MKVFRLAWIGSFAGLVLLAACPDTGTDPSIDPDHGAAPAGQALALGVESAAELLVPVLGTFACPDGGSATLNEPDPTDPDLDGIPGDARLTFDNCRTTVGSVTVNVAQGVIQLVDQDNAAANFRFQRTETNFTVQTTLPEVSIDVVRNATGSGSIEATGFRVFFEYDTLITSQLSTGERLEISADAGWTVFYEPDVAWTPGQPLAAGTVTVSGPWDIVVDGRSAITVVGTTTPLVVDPNCTTAARVAGGRVAANFDGDSIEVNWDACGLATTFHNGDQTGSVDTTGNNPPAPTPTPQPTETPTGSGTPTMTPTPTPTASPTATMTATAASTP